MDVPDISSNSNKLSSKLIAWYDRHHRDLPWRVSPPMARSGITANPYHVWLSEVMLQQTTVQAVKSYFRTFLERWPTVEALASAPTDDVMAAWAGLGYYARARNLKACAETVVRDHGGAFPDTEEGLRTLPGIGDYTAAAIAAIAFDRPAAVMDGNVERVISRLYAIDAPLPGSKPLMREKVRQITPQSRPGDFAQAMMDLGATICTPKRPACALCPFNADCTALAKDDPERFPSRRPRSRSPSGRRCLRCRGSRGLSAAAAADRQRAAGGHDRNTDHGMDSAAGRRHRHRGRPLPSDWQPCGVITHVFTHFELRLTVYRAGPLTRPPQDHGFWVPVTELDGQALPTVMKKAISQLFQRRFQPAEDNSCPQRSATSSSTSARC